MNPSVLTVYKSPYPKKRLGKDFDGGYIVVDIPEVHYSLLLSGGIQNDISFEEDFIHLYSVNCYTFDGTIQRLPKENKSLIFVKKNIGATNSEILTNLHDLLESHANLFIKMDIEGGEIPWIKSLKEDHLDKIDQLIMEFHFPFSTEKAVIFDILNKTHVLVHFHGNNYCGVRYHMGVVIPNVFECTYLHKKFFTGPLELNTERLPSQLDMRNIITKPEIMLNYWPFCS